MKLKGATMWIRPWGIFGALTVAAVFLTTGCQTLEIDPSHDRSAVELAELRARALRSTAVVRSGESVQWTPAVDFRVSADSARWQDTLGRQMAISIRELEAVRFERNTAAALSGAVVGVSAGALIGYSQADDPEWWSEAPVYAGAAIGGILGAAVGRLVGLPITYRFR